MEFHPDTNIVGFTHRRKNKRVKRCGRDGPGSTIFTTSGDDGCNELPRFPVESRKLPKGFTDRVAPNILRTGLHNPEVTRNPDTMI